MSDKEVLMANGWTLYAHPCFLEQFESLTRKVEELRNKLPGEFHKKNDAKRLAAISRLAWEIIPQDPEKEEYRQGDTLGDGYKHWFRARFFQQYRLFFRYNKASKIIIYGWVNDEKSKRAYNSATDAYRVFARMLKKGQPPDDWDTLLKEARTPKPEADDLLLSVTMH